MIPFECSYRSRDMTPRVRDGSIEEYVLRLLKEYKPELLEFPPKKINAFHFVESYLGAHLEFQDIYYEEGAKPILGMTCFGKTTVRVFDREHFCTKNIEVPENTIILDNSLMKEGNEALANFTVLHEAGHFCMHREVYENIKASGYRVRFCSRKRTKSSGRKALNSESDFREHQADVFAAAVAMPRPCFVPFICILNRYLGYGDGVFVTGLPGEIGKIKDVYLKALLKHVAAFYQVSTAAVQIRMERLELKKELKDYKGDLVVRVL